MHVGSVRVCVGGGAGGGGGGSLEVSKANRNPTRRMWGRIKRAEIREESGRAGGVRLEVSKKIKNPTLRMLGIKSETR